MKFKTTTDAIKGEIVTVAMPPFSEDQPIIITRALPYGCSLVEDDLLECMREYAIVGARERLHVWYDILAKDSLADMEYFYTDNDWEEFTRLEWLLMELED